MSHHQAVAVAAAGEALVHVDGGPQGEPVHIDPSTISPASEIDGATVKPDPLISREAAAGLNGGNVPLGHTDSRATTATERLAEAAKAAGHGGGLGI